MSGQTFELIEPFDTDDGSLNGVSPELAFALGVEWAMFRQKLLLNEKGGAKPFTELCLEANEQRFLKMVERHGRYCESRPTDRPGWKKIWVGDLLAVKRERA